MKAPIFVRPLLTGERVALRAGLRSADAFVLRRCQILLASARGRRASQIATDLGCDADTVLHAIHAFNERGLDCLNKRSSRPHTIQAAFDTEGVEQLRALLHLSPRHFGKAASLWTLDLVAEVCYEQGWTRVRVSGETIRATLTRQGIRWKRAKRWIRSPDPAYQRKKHARDRLIAWALAQPTWALGFQDETWWSRLSPPTLQAWAAPGTTLRLVEQTRPQDDPDPKALACYGVLVSCPGDPASLPEQVWLRFVDGRPVSAVTIQFLDWGCAKLQALGKAAWLLIWDNASWHASRAVREWIRAHNQQVKQTGHGVRILVCPLPSKSPWLNPIEPCWRHGKRQIVEPTRLLSAQELADRVCAHFGCSHEPHLTVPEKVV